MSESSGNPFVLPGMGQQSDLSGNPLLASMEMMRQAWTGLAGPGGLAQALPMTPPANLEDLDRRIADLRAVESWLRLNLSMLGSTIQGMEVQRATIATLRSFVDGLSSTGAASAPGEPSPLEVVLGLKPAPGGLDTSAGQPAHSAGQKTAPPSDQAYNPASQSSAAQSASQMWWDLLQQQFNSIASAAAASMSGMPGGQAQPPEPAPKPAAAPAARKKAAAASGAASPARKKPARQRAAASTAGKP